MSDAKHTPGPWDANTGYANPEFLPLMKNQRVRVIMSSNPDCDVAYLQNLRPKEEEAANANLIAACPELLQACKAVLNDTGIKAMGIYQWQDAKVPAMLASAIAKAEGEDHE